MAFCAIISSLSGCQKPFNPSEVTGIELDASAVKATYKEGETFEPMGLVVYAVDSAGRKEKVDSYSADTDTVLRAGEQTVTISSTIGGKVYTAELPVIVDEREYVYYTTEKGTLIAPVFDVQPRMFEPYSYAKLRSELAILRNMGFSRIYFVACNEGYPMFSVPRTAPIIAPSRATNFSVKKNIEVFGGDINAAVAETCLALGIEAVAIFKPYENGGELSIPAGTSFEEDVFFEETVGGTKLFYDTLASERPELRVARKNDYDEADYNDTVTKIEIEFMLDAYLNRSRWSQSMVTGISPAAVKTPKINLWVSRDNGAYTLYDGELQYSYALENRIIYDSNGLKLYDSPKKCNVLTITGINIGPEYQYAAVTLDSSSNMRTIPYSMIRWYSGEKELKLTAGIHVRSMDPNAEEGNWTPQNTPVPGTDLVSLTVLNGEVSGKTSKGETTDAALFYKNGFAFSWYGIGHNGDGWVTSPIYGIARGRQPYMGGALCEAYPEVRQYWLDSVKKLLDAGFKAVDIRLQSHSSMVTDYMSYGFNEPIVEKYKELYGVDITAAEMTEDIYLNIMKIRGDYFMLFMEDAATLIHERGALLITHLKAANENPSCDTIWNQLCHWTMPKISIDWKRCVELSDEITIKDYYYNDYRQGSASKIKDYAASLGKKVWVHCYYQQANELTEKYFDAVEKDDRISGILIYEVSYAGAFISDLQKMLDKYGFSAK